MLSPGSATADIGWGAN